MADLPVAKRQAVSALIEQCPDHVLRDLGVGLRTVAGDGARAVAAIIEEEMDDRALRSLAFGPMEALFRVRSDSVEARTLPPPLGRALWRALKARQPELIEAIRPSAEQPQPQPSLLNQLCAATAGLLRDSAAVLWPANPALPEDAAIYFDLAPLARRAYPQLTRWTGRMTSAEATSLRLVLSDAGEAISDGAPRIIEILFANMDDASLVLRLIAQAGGAVGDDQFLATSELSDFGDRLFRAVESRSERVCQFDPAHADQAQASAVGHDIAFIAHILEEMALSLDLAPEGEWGRRAQGVKARLSQRIERLLAESEKAVDQALPLTRVPTAGRMNRLAPQLDVMASGPAMDRAHVLMLIFHDLRQTAAVFGCAGRRIQTAEALSQRLGAYGDEALDWIKTGGADDADQVIALVEAAASFLTLAGDEGTAKALRRRLGAAQAAKSPESGLTFWSAF